MSGTEQGITSQSAEIPANPKVPCVGCVTEERFMTVKRSDEWSVEITDDETGEWVAYCPDCSVETGTGKDGGQHE